MKTVIGLAGVKTSGKSTVANIIMDFTGAQESALADKLKNTCAEAFNLTRDDFDSQALKEVPFAHAKTVTRTNIKTILTCFGLDLSLSEKLKHLEGTSMETPRRIAQFVGTEVLRSLGNPDIHCESVSLSDGITIISDMRFPNEYEYFKRMDGINFIPLYIARDLAEAEVTPQSHPSETSVFLFSDKCERVDNNGTLDSLANNIKNALNGRL